MHSDGLSSCLQGVFEGFGRSASSSTTSAARGDSHPLPRERDGHGTRASHTRNATATSVAQSCHTTATKVRQKWEPLYSLGMAKLKPEGPPGRANRKARAYTAEIVALVDEGYTLAAIRDALEVDGLVVSRSTVHRELRRGRKEALGGGRRDAAAVESTVAARTERPVTARPVHPADGTTVRTEGRPEERQDSPMKRAEEFARSHVSNPLLKGNRK